MFRHYLKALKRKPKADKRRLMIVEDPKKANAFLIDHEWTRYLKSHHCKTVLKNYISEIVHRVVNEYPYYNRSQGYDHFMMNVYDHGPFCKTECNESGDHAVLFKIMNVSFIGK